MPRHSVIRTALLSLLLAGLALAAQAEPARAPLLIQGALQMETAHLVSQLKGARKETIGGWAFWRGNLYGYPVVVSQTRMGMAHAAAATALAIQRYHPVAIINQGTAGGHDPALHVGDIVLGASSVSIAAFKTPLRQIGAGSHTLDWVPMDLMQRPGDDDGALHEGQATRLAADRALLSAALQSAEREAKAGVVPKRRIISGVIGSGEVWNQELDRIARLRAKHGTDVEEMETAPAAQVASLFKLPFLGIRVVTANVTNGGAYDAATAQACQEFVLGVVRRYVAGLKTR